jgi:SNF2 family DNA or RNA helicase
LIKRITLLVAIAQASASPDPTVRSQIPPRLRQSRTMVLCPPTLVDNWMDELLTWAPNDLLGTLLKVDATIKPRFRLQHINQWYEEGGVLVMGYEMFRAFILNKETTKHAAFYDSEEHKEILEKLLNGPNIIIADEAHKLKNATSGLADAASRFKSMSRIALTGSPLANNVTEYHTMINWVAPNYLGPISEFRQKYVQPIETGLWMDSTSYQRRKSLKMLGVLKEDIAPKVNRADMSVLRNDLPPKKEFIIFVPLTELQTKAYLIYVRLMLSGEGHTFTRDGQLTQSTIWHWLAILQLLCNHPACFSTKLNDRKSDAKEAAASQEKLVSPDGDDVENDVANGTYHHYSLSRLC